MSLFIIYILALTLPGAVLCYALRLEVARGALSIALALGLLLATLLVARGAGLGVHGFGYLLGVVYALTAAGAATTWWLKPPLPESGGGADRQDGVWFPPLITLSILIVYLLWAGPYTEIPSDAWWHIGRINDRLELAASGSIGAPPTLAELFDKQAGYWYTILAYFLHVTGTRLETGLQPLAVANTLLFSAGIYSFALYVFRDLVARSRIRHWVAAASVLFFVAHFGISVFSYVRYYIFAPTILNYVVYVAALSCVLVFIRTERGAWRLLAITGGLGIIAALLHMQEAVFIVVMAGTVVLAECLRVCASGVADSSTARRASDVGQRGMRMVVLLATMLVAFLLVHAWAYIELPRHNPLNHGVMADIRHYIPFVRNLYVLKPEYQFYQVLTVWGILVYILFLVYFRRFSRSPYLIAGMAIPVVTVFNPVFTDFFLRFSWPEVLWRMCYMVPLPLLGGYFLVQGVGGIRWAPGVARKALSGAMAAALLILLLPFNTTYFVSPYSKIYTLAPVGASNDYRIWQDLLSFLDSQDSAIVVTDPVTGYVINGLTAHRYPGYKFYGWRTLRVDRQSYAARNFRVARGGLVVINKRNGAPSGTGQHGGHWSAEVMQVSTYYSPEFESFVSGHPGIFKLLWESDRISVYRMVDVDAQP